MANITGEVTCWSKMISTAAHAQRTSRSYTERRAVDNWKTQRECFQISNKSLWSDAKRQRACILKLLPFFSPLQSLNVFKSFKVEVTIWYLKRGLWSCKQLCFLIGPQLYIWSRVILDWTLLATGNLKSLLEKLLSCQWQLGRSSSLRLKISLVLQRLSVGLKDMLSQKMADQHLQQIVSFWLQVKIWNYPTKRVSLSGRGYSTQTSKLIILSSLLQRLTKGSVLHGGTREETLETCTWEGTLQVTVVLKLKTHFMWD